MSQPPLSHAASAIVARPLTPEAFAPFGHVARPGLGEVKAIRGGGVRLSKSSTVFDHLAAAPDATLDFYEVEPEPGPLDARVIERHPRSSQLFCPMGAARWLVAVWPEGPEAPPLAFVAGPRDVVTYAPGLWHHGIVALDRPACFASLMWKAADRAGDTEFLDLATPVRIEWGAA
ncbi:ureidoglycolate lyase [Pseudodonghicola flavimaris]|uniref:Ureidoglycolate lyase n=1 Tax=Pseudodonghicola flavimaris TaxID=3050036 RepID=A0ABT7F2L3_9RHOB|nr:ureidoglycolate lyase [Pseudodonghicola flavimaris]MDK3018846.1 ureidoglycolate lyase [Pseudodonghicola flavimaris]